jgi:uncharacterized repeat protein (TIGR03803 family)
MGRRKTKFVVSALSVVLGMMAGAVVLRGQSETVLYRFAGYDGTNPYGGLVADSSGNLYGTTPYGGDGICNGMAGCGVVFELVNSSGTYTEKVLYRFTGGDDGGWPYAGLIADSSGNLYGTAVYGGAYGNGTVFELVKSSGTYTEKTLYSFIGGDDGGYPLAGLIADSAGNLYGTTAGGGGNGKGTVFELVNSSGTYTEKVLYRFTGGDDGGWPYAGLIADSTGNLYGTTTAGGAYRGGTVFELVNSSGTYTEKVLHSFSDTPDGAGPTPVLIADSSGNLYGTTNNGGGLGGGGTVFELVNSSGTYTEKVLYRFGVYGTFDGAFPYAGLIADSSGNLYGTTRSDVNYGGGTVFELVNSSGTYTEKVLYSFSGMPDGAVPYAGLIADSSGNLYGTTAGGGYSNCATGADVRGCGTAFKLELAPDFTVGVASGSSSSASVSPGGTVSYSLSVTPERGFNQAVTLACTGAPSEATCTVSPSSVTLDGTNTQTASVNVSTTAPSMISPPDGRVAWPILLALLLAAIGFCEWRHRQFTQAGAPRRWRQAVLAATLFGVGMMAACGGASSGPPPNPGTPAGTYTLTVTGTSSDLSHSTTLTLTVK